MLRKRVFLYSCTSKGLQTYSNVNCKSIVGVREPHRHHACLDTNFQGSWSSMEQTLRPVPYRATAPGVCALIFLIIIPALSRTLDCISVVGVQKQQDPPCRLI